MTALGRREANSGPGIFVGMMAYYAMTATATVLWASPLLLVQVLFTFAIISLASTLPVHFPDIGRAASLVLAGRGVRRLQAGGGHLRGRHLS